MIQPVFASTSYQTLEVKAHQKHLADDPYWRRLLHYRRNLTGIYESEIDDPSFFISPRGRKDPGAELDATLEAFFASPQPSPTGRGQQSLGEAEPQPAQCRYPARLAWLKEQLAINPSDLPQVACPRYDNWRAQINPGSVSLVFASSYMNNPSSMYGHTFLLLNAKGKSASERLLNYAVNFAADLEHDNGFLYAVKGLFGGYRGRFSTFPYYMKVQEYSNMESRDLWEYDLNLPPEAIERLVEHLWELGNVRIRYFFFNKNCSYYLMPVLEVAEPSRDFKSTFVFKTIPVDTIRVVIRPPGMLAGVTRRPSHTSKLLAERAQLTEPEIRMAEQLSVTPSSAEITGLAPERQALVLDTAYDLFRTRVGFNREQPPAVQEKENQLLLERNRIGVPSAALDVSSANVTAPNLAHKTGRVGLAYGFSNRSHFEELAIRAAAHDQDDPPEGYLPGSRLEMFDAKFRYDDDRKTLYVERFALADILSLTPWDPWIHPPSWKVNTGLGTAHDLNRDPENSLYYGLNFGSGYAAWGPGERKLLFYGMGEAVLQLGHAFSNDVRFGGGPTGGVLWTPVRFWRARFEMSYTPYAVGGTPSTTKLSASQSFSLTKDFELRTALERQNAYKEVLLSAVLFL